MKRFRVAIAPRVFAQIREHALYIALDSVEKALDWESRVSRAILSLEYVRGYSIDESATERLGQTIHKYVFERTFLIHFRLNREAHVVEIIGFRHGARLPRSKEP